MGDSRARNLFMAARILFGVSNRTEYGLKFNSEEYDVRNVSGIPNILFRFDPYLNATFSPDQNSRVIISSGLWYLKNMPFNLAYNQFAKDIDKVLLMFSNVKSLTIKLISPLIEEDLSPARRDKLKNSDVSQFNRYLRDISPGSARFPLVPESMNAMYELVEKASPDGLHYPYSVVSEELNIYLNGICNEIIYSGNKGKTTCCTDASVSNFSSLAFVWGMIFVGGSFSFYSVRNGE